jgi:hypothetical protein
VEVTLDLPGAYEVVVEAAESGVADEPRPYSLTLGVEYGGPLPRVVLPSELSPTVAGGEGDADGATTLVDGRYTLNTRRGGSLSAGNAVARSLNLEGPDVVADFTLVADVHVDQVGGPAAATVRFRYQPEAGGGAGYLLSVDPFRGQVRLEGFDEGHREALTPWIDHPAAAVGSSTMRLMIRASGPTISASVDGQAVLRTVDARFADGMIVVGAVTWSDPITATFDNVLVTIPAP